ncbi:transport protein [Musa troglodytarum]|uniref:Transport protein n=1 Tax=Musa troglodytarum TaxID=320322 RepID=A0A9E7KWB9_9LILI|nr:transport protein [Musa troglodytarum]
MACIKSAARSALVAFAPDAPYLAAGTMAGAVDLSFSSTANLEIFKLDFQSDAHDLPVAGACPSDERFNRLSWGKPPGSSEEFSLGLDLNDSSVAKLAKHVGPVRGLEFSTLSPNLLASGADEGELCIWDLAKPSEPKIFPSLRSVGSGAQTEVSFVSWNPMVQHILSSTFADSNRRRCSVLQWNPDVSTELIVASDDDSSPSLRVWDLMNTMLPVREFVGHTKGVIAMSWCPYDCSFLLTCAKDNRTICWDTTTGEMVCELPASTNWNFDIHWYPKSPGVISASSFDVKVGIYNIEACSKHAAVEGEFVTPVRLRAPKWLRRPVGVSFGFGGKLISFQPCQSAPGVPSSASEVYTHNLVTEHSLVSRSTEFEAAIQNGEKSSLCALCEQKSHDSISEDDRETWGFLKIMFEEEGTARTKLLSYLGFTLPEECSDIYSDLDNLGKGLEKTLSLDTRSSVEVDASTCSIDNGEEFFNNPQISEDSSAYEEKSVPNGEKAQKEPEEPSRSYDPSFDDSIQHALVVGDYKGAVLRCIVAHRMADALVIAHAGGSSLWESTRDQYLKNSLAPYLKVVSALVRNDLMALVNTRPLNSWKETLALLCTFAQKEEWTVLCDSLASRLMAIGNMLAATLCYICAGNMNRTVEIWSHSLKLDSRGKTYIDLLQKGMCRKVCLIEVVHHTLNLYMVQINLAMDKNLSQPLPQLHQNAADTSRAEGFHQAPGSAYRGNQLVLQKPQVPDFSNQRLFHPSQPSQNFIPSHTSQISQQAFTSPATMAQPTMKPFSPATPAALRNVERYQQPSLGSQLYPGAANPLYQHGPPIPAPQDVGASQPASVTGQRFAQPISTTTAPRGFTLVYNPNFAQRPSISPVHPLSPTKSSEAQPVGVPPAPPPTVQTVDTSNVPAEWKLVIATLTRLYNEASAALGGANANPSKKREIEDNSRKIGALIAKLNSGDISPNAAAKLVQLCQALDAGDFAGALQIQVVLTTSDWDECNFWLVALKRMIKTRQNVRLYGT